MLKRTAAVRKMLSLAMCLIFAFGALSALSGGTAEARESLPYIERIKKQGGAFRILEILPDGSEGGIGYLVKGQEPAAGWAMKAALSENADTPEARKSYIDDLFGDLEASGLLASGDTAPLRLTGGYTEFFPWQEHEGAFALKLDHEEMKKNVSGTFTAVEDGAYDFTGGYKAVSKGTHVQDITYFSAAPEGAEDDYYWYEPVFTQLPAAGEVPEGTAVYKNTENFNAPAKEPAFDSYVFIGVYGEPGFEGLAPGKKYYTAEADEKPAEKKQGKKIYAAISEGFVPVQEGQEGFFKQDKSEYLYVGTGGGYNYSAEGSGKHDIRYDTVYYTGGFENNEWFLRHVFDWEEGEARPQTAMSVVSVSVTDLTQSQIDTASMIVISSGLAPGKAPLQYSAERDIAPPGSASYDRLLELCLPEDGGPAGKPVIIDASLSGGSLNINALARELTGGKTEAHVSGNIFGAGFPLVSAGFVSAFDEAEYKSYGSPFYEVYRQIDYENFLRGEEGNLLPEQVSPAAAIRHIIAGSRGTAVKNTIEVLEIQPGKTGEISVEAVRSWLSADDSLEVNITTQSVSELIGKIEVIAQTYDLVYIGSCTEDFVRSSVNGELITSYNDRDMNGLIYTNIGDTVRSGGESGFSLSGLLDRDYSDAIFTHQGESYRALKTGYNEFGNLYEPTRTFRLSGNDLTPQKLLELMDYADSGYPVVLANNLYSSLTIGDTRPDGGAWSYYTGYCRWGLLSDCRYNISLEASGSDLSLAASLTMQGVEGAELQRVSVADFKWYKYVDGVNDILIKEDKNVPVPQYDRAVSYLSLPDNEYVMADGLASGAYYCEVYAVSINSGQNAARDVTPSRSKLALLSGGVNEQRVDNSSMMFELLEGIEGKRGVMSEWQTGLPEKRALLERSANLQKPEIVFSVAEGKKLLPEPYTGLNGESLSPIDPGDPDSGYELSFRVTLKNEADPDIAPYLCRLYVDLNGDGRYSEDERLRELTIREWNTGTGSAGAEVSENDLQTGREYLISRRLPADMLGIVPWSLEFEKTTSARVRVSQTGYTHVKPSPERVETIDILQINTEDNLPGKGLNLETDPTFQRLFDEVRGEFDINLMTVGAKELDTLLGSYNKYLADTSLTPQGKDSPLLIEYLRENKDSEGNILPYSGLSELLDSFDMLVLGFGDSYQGISGASAAAIADFIKTGKAILFSHDCSSYFFLPFKEYETENEQFKLINAFRTPDFVYSKTNFAPLASFNMFGYEFNMAIRDAVGLDRYGVTNPVYGITEYAPDRLKTGIADDPATEENDAAGRLGIVSSEDYTIEGLSQSRTILGSTKTILEHLKDEGYSIAYKPGSAKSETVPETQGLSSGILMRFYKGGGRPTVHDTPSGDGTLQLVSEISQINEGRITIYPYDINTQAFGGTDSSVTKPGTTDRIAVTETHCQYQQLNMNSGDIVVWYCLAGESFEGSPNDVMNSYYLYSRGNVTYTGFGHTTKSVNETEAKLFVNTMTAAYRTAQSAPRLSFTDSTGKKDMTSFLMPSDNGEIIKTGGESDKTRRIFFALSDINAGEGKALSVSFAYGEEAKPLSGLRIYDAASETPVSDGTGLSTGKTYYIRLDEVLSSMGDAAVEGIGASGISLTASAKSEGAGNTSVSADTLVLRKLDLLNLY